MPILRTLFAILAMSATALAADQSFSLTDKPKYIDPNALITAGGQDLISKTDASIKLEHVKELLDKLFNGQEALDHPYIIHAIRWKDNTTTVASGADHWYVYDPTLKKGGLFKGLFEDVETQSRFESDRIFGSKKLTLVYIHLNAIVQPNLEQLKQEFIKGLDGKTLPPKFDAQRKPVTVTKEDLAQTLVTQGSTATQFQLANQNGTSITLDCNGTVCVDDKYTDVVYEIAVTKKTPQPLSDLKTLAGIIGAQGAVESVKVTTTSGVLYQSLEMSGVLTPSSLAIGGKIGQAPQDAKISEHAFTDEGKYWGGLSFAVPINSYKDVSFDENNPSLQPKTVKRENIYAVADLYLPKIDLSNPQKRLIPHALAGMPIKNSPLNHLMVGTGIGFNYVEPFVGVVFNRTKQPKPGVVSPKTSNDLETRVVRKLVVGINLPVGTVKKLLSGK